MLPVLIFKY